MQASRTILAICIATTLVPGAFALLPALDSRAGTATLTNVGAHTCTVDATIVVVPQDGGVADVSIVGTDSSTETFCFKAITTQGATATDCVVWDHTDATQGTGLVSSSAGSDRFTGSWTAGWTRTLSFQPDPNAPATTSVTTIAPDVNGDWTFESECTLSTGQVSTLAGPITWAN